MQAEYTTLADYGTDEFVEKRSRFIGYAKPVTHRGRGHRLYWRDPCPAPGGQPQCLCLCPAGRAGAPVFGRWRAPGNRGNPGSGCAAEERYCGAVLVVIPVFRRHPAGSRRIGACLYRGRCIAVRAARPRVMSPCTVLQMDIDYGQYGKITYILPKYHTVTLESDFGAAVRMQILIKDKYIEAFRKELTELTSATVVPYELEHRFDEIPE